MKKKPVYLKGLGDLFANVSMEDNPLIVADSGESLSVWAGVSGTTVALSSVQVRDGNTSLFVSGVTAIGDGAILTPVGSPVDYSDANDKFLVIWVYPLAASTGQVVISDGTNSETFNVAALTANQWNEVIINTSAPDSVSGTLDWSAIQDIEFNVQTVFGNFYIDSVKFYDQLIDREGLKKVRIGCLNELGLERNNESIDLKCSRNEIVESDVSSTEFLVSATVKDFDPEGKAVLGGGNITTDSVTALVESELFTVPATPFQYVLSDAANLKVGNGYGVWVMEAETGKMFQEAPRASLIPAGYYHLDAVTGTLTFSSSDAGKDLSVSYTVVVTGRTLVVTKDSKLREFSCLFQIKGSNDKTGLYVFPRLKPNSNSDAPELEDYWAWEFEAKALVDPATGKYYEFHVKD